MKIRKKLETTSKRKYNVIGLIKTIGNYRQTDKGFWAEIFALMGVKKCGSLAVCKTSTMVNCSGLDYGDVSGLNCMLCLLVDFWYMQF